MTIQPPHLIPLKTHPDFALSISKTKEDFAKACKVRYEVFVKEQVKKK